MAHTMTVSHHTFLSPHASTVIWEALDRAWSGQQDGAHDHAHIQRVRTNALRLMASTQEPVDAPALEAAAILHDLIPIAKNDPRRAQASKLAADAAGPILHDAGLHPHSIAITVHAIHAHSWSSGVTPTSIEAYLLRDADRLDALGAIGVARCLLVSGQLGRALHHPTDPHARHRDLDEQSYAYDHVLAKLYHLVDGLHTQAARYEGHQRLDTMRQFWDAVFAESGHTPSR